MRRKIGAIFNSWVGWFCYITTTIISATLNIYLLSNLDSTWKLFLLSMSLSLEFGKALILVRANTYKSLKEYLKNCKFEFGKVHKKMIRYYAFYVTFAVLSVTAGLCYSLTITDKSEQGFAIEKQAIVQNINSVTESREKYTAALEKFTMLQDNSDESEKLAREEMWAAEDAYKKLANQWDIKQRELTTEEFEQWKLDVDYSKVKRDYQRAKEDYESIQKGTALVRAENTYKAAESEYNNKVALLGALDDLNLQLSELNKKELAAAGSSKCFILLAQTLGIPDKVKQVKFFILFYVSLLIEFLIWLSSPDLKLDGDLLYSYRNDIGLTTKKDADKLFKEIEDTNKRYSQAKEEKPKEKIIEKDTPKTLKELENLKEQVALLERTNSANVALIEEQKCIIDDLADPIDAIAWENMQQELEDDQSIYECEVEMREKAESDLERAENAFAKVSHMLKEERDYRDASDDNAKFYIDKSDNLEKELKQLKEEKEEDDKNYFAWHDRCIEYENKTAELEKQVEEWKHNFEERDKDALKYTELWEESQKAYEQVKQENEDKKYSEEDLKELLSKASKKSKEKILELSKHLSNYEKEYDKLSEKYSNLEIANHSLESRVQEVTAEKEIDQVLNGEITDSEIDQVLEENKTKNKGDIIIKSAEDQLNDMLDDLTGNVKTVKIDV